MVEFWAKAAPHNKCRPQPATNLGRKFHEEFDRTGRFLPKKKPVSTHENIAGI
jgi:hypothetical protein